MNTNSAGGAFRDLASALAKKTVDLEELTTAAATVLEVRTELLLSIQRLLDCPDLQLGNLEAQSIRAREIADRLICSFDQAKVSKGETALGLRLILEQENSLPVTERGQVERGRLKKGSSPC